MISQISSNCQGIYIFRQMLASILARKDVTISQPICPDIENWGGLPMLTWIGIAAIVILIVVFFVVRGRG